jgi:SAM-dependent methyltransferase
MLVNARWLQVRARVPKPRWARALYRLAKSLAVPAEPSQWLPPALLAECRFAASRLHMLEMLPTGGRVAELGTYRGEFARFILERNAPQELHVVDVDYSAFDLSDDRLRRHQGLSHEIIAKFPDNFFDWIYVDAGHDYASVMRDAYASAPKVKPGGCLVFNDFAHIDGDLGRYGVHRAVVDFAIEKAWPLCFFAYSTDALYDVALRRPIASS